VHLPVVVFDRGIGRPHRAALADGDVPGAVRLLRNGRLFPAPNRESRDVLFQLVALRPELPEPAVGSASIAGNERIQQHL